MKSPFDKWWDSDYDDSLNPYTKNTPCYWAWAGWQAAQAEGISYRKAYPENFVKPWVGLTDEELQKILQEVSGQGWKPMLEAIEAKLKEKNT